MIRAQREVAQALGQFADARGVKLRVGVAMPKPGAGHEISGEAVWILPETKRCLKRNDTQSSQPKALQ